MRFVPFDESRKGIRRGDGSIRDPVFRNRRRLRGLPRRGLGPRDADGVGSIGVGVVRGGGARTRSGVRALGRVRALGSRRVEAGRGRADRYAHEAARARFRDRRLCPVSFAAQRPGRSGGAGRGLSRWLPPFLADARSLLRGRTDLRRGLCLRLLPAEQDARGRRPLQRLPRSPFARASARRQCPLFELSRSRSLRYAGASWPRSRDRSGCLRDLSHARSCLHASRRATRSFLSDSAPGSARASRDARRLRALPSG